MSERIAWKVRRYSDGSIEVGSQYGSTRFHSVAAARNYYVEAGNYLKAGKVTNTYADVLRLIRESR